MKRSSFVRGLVMAAFLALTASSASAVTLSVVDGGLTNQNQNYGCQADASLCGIPPYIFLRDPNPALATGTIDITGTTASIVLHVDYVLFDQWNPAGNGVAFTDVTYSASIPVSLYGSSVFQSGVGSATISGLANGTSFSVTPQVTNFTCGSTVASTQCGIQFGENGFTTLGYDFVHTFNVLATPVPEPMAGLLVLVGLAGLARRARRA